MEQSSAHAAWLGPDLTVICPFFNEEALIAQSISTLIAALESGPVADWELIVVDDGSTDASLELATAAASGHKRVRVLSYPTNRGRGHALRWGLNRARGRILVTTEIDLSWGRDIVARLYAALEDNPRADVVVASPHMADGGYRNVPRYRTWLSRLGNHVIRAFMSGATSMNTGMTRAYRREAILDLPLEEDGKEFHLEVVLKGEAMRLQFHEIPAVLEWPASKQTPDRAARTSSGKIKRLVVGHTLFSLFARPARWIWPISLLALVLGGVFLIAAFVRLFMGLDSIFLLIVSLTLAIIGTLLFTLGVITHQNSDIQKELWSLKAELRRAAQPPRPVSQTRRASDDSTEAQGG